MAKTAIAGVRLGGCGMRLCVISNSAMKRPSPAPTRLVVPL